MGEGVSRRLTDEVCITLCHHIPSAHMLHSRCPVSATPTHMLRICVNPRPSFICGRADNACTNLLGFLVRYVRTRGSMRLRRIQNYRLSLCHFPHALATHYFLRLTRARGKRYIREGNTLLYDFCRAFGHSKAREGTPLLRFFAKNPQKQKTRLFRTLEKRVIMPAYRVICLN